MTHLPVSSSKKLSGGGSGVSNRGDGMVDLLGVFLEMVRFFFFLLVMEYFGVWRPGFFGLDVLEF